VDIVESKSRHDFAQCSCHSIAVDGGLDYTRHVGDRTKFLPVPPEPLPQPYAQLFNMFSMIGGKLHEVCEFQDEQDG
jgi:hypothetical protein